MLAKHKIIHESDDDNVEDRPKKPRSTPDNAPPGMCVTYSPTLPVLNCIGTEVVTNGAGTQHSERSGRGHRG
jgi:hypothetical protein